MIHKEQILKIVENNIDASKQFVVDVTVSAANKINVMIDGYKGLSIDDCVALSRKIEKGLDRETEDFELEVSSPGLTQPFKVLQQYKKNIGKEVEVLFNNGAKTNAKLLNVAENGIDLEEEKIIKPEGSKKKQKIIEKKFVEFESIKSTKLIISFK
jgi:ribosome maturation factor RimP